MRYLKIYENYFLEKDKVEEISKKIDDDFTQEVLDLIPDISSIDGFEYSKSVKTNVLENELYEFEFKMIFKKRTTVEDYKSIIISELYRLNSILGKIYNIKHSILFLVYKDEQAKDIIQRERFSKLDFKDFKEIIENIEIFYKRLKNDHPSTKSDKISFFNLTIHILRS